MPEAGGPWEPDPADRSRTTVPRARLLLWLAALVSVAGGVWLLFKAFPGAVNSAQDWVWVGWGVFMMGLFSTALLDTDRIRWAQAARHAAIWAGVVALLILGVTYRAELAGVAQRVRMTLSSSHPVATGPRELVVTQTGDGAFFVMGKVNGQLVRFLVDTGASDTVLSPADAGRLGVDMTALRFDQAAETANGVGYGAALTVDTLAVGSIAFDNVPVIINQAPMSHSLLGMTFLRRLESFRVTGDKLYLTARP